MDEPRAPKDDPVAVALSNLDRRVTETDARVRERLEAYDHYRDARLNAVQASIDAAEESNKTALNAAKDALDDRMRARDEQLLIRINAQRESERAALAALDKLLATNADKVEQRFASMQEAVRKAEAADEKRFECVAADTPILCADMTWRQASALRVGDEIVAFDEESPTRRGRLFRKATVTANAVEQDQLVEVATEGGVVRCNSQHPWLARHAGDHPKWEWIKTSDLLVGDEVLRSLDPWSVDESWDAGWLAGIFDGEGCLCLNKNGGVQLSVTQRLSDTSDRIALTLEKHLGHEVLAFHTRVRSDWSEIVHFIVSTRADVLTLLGTVRPPRLLHRAEGVWNGKPIGGKNRVVRITAIDNVGRGDIAALSTSTGTYIAAGFAMHNSVNEFRAQAADRDSQRVDNKVFKSEIEKLDVLIARNREDLAEMRQLLASGAGRSEGVSATGRLIATAIGVAVSVITVVVAVASAVLR